MAHFQYVFQGAVEAFKKSWPHWRLAFYLGTAVLAFSSIEIIANPIRQDLDPLVLTFWRFLLGALCLLPFLLRDPRLKELTRRDLGWLGILGCLNVILSMGAHAISIKYAKASTAAILLAANPIATNLFAWMILREKLGWRRGGAIALGTLGVTLIALRPSLGLDTPVGIAAGIIGLLGFALYIVLSKGIVQKLGSLVVATVSFLLAVMVDLPILLTLHVPLWPPANTWPRLLILGFIVSGLGYIAFFKALEHLPAGKTSLLFFFKPPVAITLAWLFLGEHPNFAALIGTMLIMSGIVFEKPTPGKKTQAA